MSLFLTFVDCWINAAKNKNNLFTLFDFDAIYSCVEKSHRKASKSQGKHK
jgi:hypothetical protein